MLDFKKLKEFDNHKLVLEIEDKEAGLHGFIAIHNDNLGSPAVGGTRMFPYKSEEDALKDVLRLSRAMTYKCAMAKVPHGGGKGVIIGDPKKKKTEELLRAYAEKINELSGQFYTGEDVGMTQDDINFLLKFSKYFNGGSDLAGDPSPYAALSVFYSIQSAVNYVYKKNSLGEVKVAIKGVGKVGKSLADLLDKAGAILYVSDIDEKALDEIKKMIPGVTIVDNEKIHTLGVDVYSPCALGDEFSIENAKEIKAKIICGGANNQLADEKVGDYLFEHGIVYVPDYVANAGGLINVMGELEEDGYKRERVLEKIKNVKKTVEEVLKLSLEKNKSPHRIADEIAENRFKVV